MSQRAIVHFSHFIRYQSFPRGGRSIPTDSQQSAAVFACCIGIMIVMLAGILLVMVPNISQESYILLVLGLLTGSIILITGVMLLRRSSSDIRRVYEILSESEEISLESISRMTGISGSRVQLFVEMAIVGKQVKGRVIDGTYVQTLVAERIDDSTVRCPHCQAELKLEDEF